MQQLLIWVWPLEGGPPGPPKKRAQGSRYKSSQTFPMHFRVLKEAHIALIELLAGRRRRAEYALHTGAKAKANFLSRNYQEFAVWKMWILWKMRLWDCEFCEKWDIEIMNFEKNETLKMWILWNTRLQKCEFCENETLKSCENNILTIFMDFFFERPIAEGRA